MRIINSQAKKVFKFLIYQPKKTLLAVFLLTLFCAYFQSKVDIDASSQTLLLENDKDIAVWRDVSQRYKSPNFLVLTFTPKEDMFSKSSLQKIDKLSQALENLPFVSEVTSILNVPLLQNKEQELSDLLKDIPNLKSKNIDLEAAKKEFKKNPLYAQNLISKDLKTSAILINLKENKKYNDFINRREDLKEKIKDKNISKDELAEYLELRKNFKAYRDEVRKQEENDLKEIRHILEENKGEDKLFLGGMNMIQNDMINFVRNDLQTYAVAVTLLLAFSLWLFFRQARFIFIPILICIVSVIVAGGIFGFFGFEITVISSNYVALQLIITISTVIHLIIAYKELQKKYKKAPQKRLLYLTLLDRANPCFFAIFTTIIGFISLVLSNIKPIIMLGIMMSLGISVSLLIAFIMFASIMSLLKKVDGNDSFANKFKFTAWCAKQAINKRKTIYIISAFLTIFGLYGASKIRFENSFIAYFKSSTDIHKGMFVIDKELGGTVPLDITLKFPQEEAEDFDEDDEFGNEFFKESQREHYFFDSSKMNLVSKVHDFLKDKNFVGNVSSLGTLLELGRTLNKGIPLDDLTLAIMYKELPPAYKDILFAPYVDINNNEFRFALRIIDSDTDLRRNDFLKELELSLSPLLVQENAEAKISGVMLLYNNVLQNLISSQINTLFFVILSLFIVFLFIFRSIKLSLIAIVTNVIPLSLIFGIMGILGIPLDIMSITIAAISIGIGVDDIIHYIYRYKAELRNGKNPVEAVQAGHASIAYAMQYTSFTVFMGFAVMLFSNFWPTIYFGLLTCLVMFMMLLSALLLAPALILTFSKTKT